MSKASTTSSEKSKSKPKTKNKKKFKFTWRRFSAYFIILLVFLYLLSLAVINTSWAKTKLTNKLKAKTNSDWQVGSVLWIPFGDIKLNDLESSMGEGGIKIKSLNVQPSWNDLFSGSLDLHGMTASEAEVDIDIKWLKENLSRNEDALLSPTPPAAINPNLAKNPQNNRPTNPQKDPSKNPSENTPVRPPQPNDKTTPQQAPKKETPKIADLPNRWIKFNKMNITLRNGQDSIGTISNISASIPFAGKPTNGELKFEFLGEQSSHQLSWNGKELLANELAGDFMSVKHQWKIVCQPNQPGIPFSFQWIVPEQKLNHNLDQKNFHINITSDKIAANFVLRGGLRYLNTWRGIFNAGSKNTTITENQKTHKKIQFDHTRMVTTISNGKINVPAAEAIGHKISILANGTIHKNLYSYGVIRLITNEESKEFFDRVHHATWAIDINKEPHDFLEPLDTPDRLFCDIFIDGKLSELEIRHHRSEHWQALKPALKKLQNFKNSELEEDGLLETE